VSKPKTDGKINEDWMKNAEEVEIKEEE